MNLRRLFDKYECDKGKKHSYDSVYESLFAPLLGKSFNFLEIGVWKGASTKAFADYFPKAQIHGIDLFVREHMDSINTDEYPNIHLYEGNSFERKAANQFEGMRFDVILDDGAHYPFANEQTFKNFSHLLAPGGMYIIEDVWPIEEMTLNEKQHPWYLKHPDRYNDFANRSFLDTLEKSGLKIERYDLRKKSRQPDSYLLVLKNENQGNSDQ